MSNFSILVGLKQPQTQIGKMGGNKNNNNVGNEGKNAKTTETAAVRTIQTNAQNGKLSIRVTNLVLMSTI